MQTFKLYVLARGYQPGRKRRSPVLHSLGDAITTALVGEAMAVTALEAASPRPEPNVCCAWIDDGFWCELENDLGAEWLLDLWETVPTPDKAAHSRETTIAKVLKRNRIRRFDAAHVLEVLRRLPVLVAAGTIEAASAHLATLIARIRLANRQLKDAHQRLDTLTVRIPTQETEQARAASSS